uniref:Uncharacterized protein n=1 Tax=Ditylenchus dipsaci TaxID=166011 RepID=A0A915D127_9BILA
MHSFVFLGVVVACACVFNSEVLAKPAPQNTEQAEQKNGSANPIAQDAKAFAAEVKQFISSLTKEQKEQLETIFKDTTATKAELSAKFHEFAGTLSQALKEQAEDLYAKVESFRQKLLAKFSTAELSPSASAALEKMKDIAEDNNLTLPAECEQAQAVIQGLSEADRQSLHIPAQKNVDCSKIGQMLFSHHQN